MKAIRKSLIQRRGFDLIALRGSKIIGSRVNNRTFERRFSAMMGGMRR